MYKNIIRILGRMGMKYMPGYFSSLKEEVKKSNLNILIEIYVGRMLFLCIVSFFITFSFIFVSFFVFGSPLWFALGSAIISSVLVFFLLLTVFHSYPFNKLSSKKTSIDSVMPFAINHMAAIAASGVPPFIIFKLMASIPEYAEIANESRRIVRNMDAFGMDILTSIKNVADRTPSIEFKQFLYGFKSAVETGGNLKSYLEESSKEAMFDYRLKREKYLQTLSAYADFYTAVLIAAPLFFISVLAVMSLLGGQIMGMDIPTVMRLGIYVLIPALNIIFITFINFTQPSV